MDTIDRYVGRDFLVTLLLTLLIFTFVMCIGAVVKAIDLLSRGVSAMLILHFFVGNIPFILAFSIPMSSLTAVLLLFGRLSLDGELTAMKACGLTIWQVISAPVILSILLSGFCLYLNSVAAPNSHYARRQLLRGVGVEEPVNLLEEGRFVRDFPGLMIYVSKKNQNEIEDVVVYELDDKGVKQSVRAQTGKIRASEDGQALLVDLYDVRIDVPDRDHPMDISRAKHITARHYPVKLDFSKIWDNKNIEKKVSDMTMSDLLAAIRAMPVSFPCLDQQDRAREKMKLMVEVNTRFALSLSCFAFILLGIPLGIKNHRRESSVGIGISLALVVCFYLFIIIADSLVAYPQLRPDLIVWIPVIGAQIGGVLLLRRVN